MELCWDAIGPQAKLGEEEYWGRDTERRISEEEWRGKKRKKRLKKMRKAEVGFEFEEDGDKSGDGVSKRIGVKCKQSELCAIPSSVGEMEVNVR